jgi:RNA polymerase sigma factor (sigma-70 family)
LANTKTLLVLVTNAKKGNRQAQNTIMNLFWEDIYRYILIKIKNENDAEDIAIETFTKLFSKLKYFNEDFDFRTWIIAIAHNTLIDHIRKNAKNNLLLEDYELIDVAENTPSPEENLIIQQNDENFLLQIKKLKTKYQEVIKLRYLEDKTYKEIAKILAVDINNVKVRLLRAKKILAESIKNNI